MAASGWQTIFAPVPPDADEFDRLEDEHPNRALGLGPHPVIGFIHREAIADAALADAVRLLLERHLRGGVLRDSRRPARRRVDDAGDAVAGGGHARRHRRLAGAVDRRDLSARPGAAARDAADRARWCGSGCCTTRRPMPAQRWSERGLRFWAERRLRRNVARDLENNTLHGAVRQAIRAGLPLTAVLIAVQSDLGLLAGTSTARTGRRPSGRRSPSRAPTRGATSMIDAAVGAPGRRRSGAAGTVRGAPAGHDRRR